MVSRVMSVDDDLSFEPDASDIGESAIQEFFSNANVFLTGGTGFMGQVLLEKLLRGCPNINHIYMLARPKKGKGMQERLDEIVDGPLFQRVKKEDSKAINKVILLAGDVALPDLGLSKEDQDTLRRNVNVVFHVAATVRFDENIRTAVTINVVGTSTLLALAKQMENLKAYVHVSTAYANCPLMSIDEVFYPPTIDKDKLVKLCECLNDKQLDILKPSLLGKWPNTYVYTKAVSEDVVKREAEGLPLAIVRPSIVVSTAKEPICGWINNLYGATGVTTAASIGLIKTLNCNASILADIVPADMVINCIIAAAWDVGRSRDNKEVTNQVEAIPIYNYVSSPQKPITWGEYMDYNEIGLQFPSVHVIWAYCLTLNKYSLINSLYMLFLHLIPALIVDGLTLLVGRKPRMWNTYKKVHKFTEVIEYFCTQQWKFKNNNVQRLWTTLGPRDQRLFQFDMAALDWKETMYVAIRGIRIYLLKDPLETVPKAIQRYKWLMILHYSLLITLSLLIGWFLYYVTSLGFSLWPMSLGHKPLPL